MKPSTPDTGPESEEFLKLERYAVDKACREIFRAWELEDEPRDWYDLMVDLNAGAARARKVVLDLHNLGKLGKVLA